MRFTCVLAAVCLAGCAVDTGVGSLYGDVMTVTRQGAHGLSDPLTVRNGAMTEARGHCTALGREIERCRTAGDEAALSARELPAVRGAVHVPGAGRSAAEGADELSPRRMGRKAQEKVKLAFCSQLLCVTPYEFTRGERLLRRPRGSTSSSSTPAAATRRCRRWSAAPSTMRRPRSTWRCRPSPTAPTSAASRPPAGCRCSRWRWRPARSTRSPASRTSRARPSGSRRSATPTTPCCSTCSSRPARTPSRSSSRCWARTSSRRCAAARWSRAWCRSPR